MDAETGLLEGGGDEDDSSNASYSVTSKTQSREHYSLACLWAEVK